MTRSYVSREQQVYMAYGNWSYPSSVDGRGLNFIVLSAPAKCRTETGALWRNQMLAVRRVLAKLTGKRGVEFSVDGDITWEQAERVGALRYQWVRSEFVEIGELEAQTQLADQVIEELIRDEQNERGSNGK